MITILENKMFGLLAIFLILFLVSCSDSKIEKKDNYLIKSGNFKVLVEDYTIAFEIAKTAYPHKFIQDKKALKNIHVRLLNQMIEEIILKRYAFEHNINLSEKELSDSINIIKKEFPDNTFETTLLENAISYQTWKKNLNNKLLMEKVIKLTLEDKIEITQKDVKKFYKIFYSKKNLSPEFKGQENKINNHLIKLLKKRKAEEQYKSWISKQEKKYPVEINKTLWEEIIKF